MDTMLKQKLQPLQLQEEEAENTNIEKILRTNPFLLENDTDTNEVADYLLPVSIGIEIECGFKYGEECEIKTLNEVSNKANKAFKEITDLLDCDVNDDEQRFRIKSGLKGMKSLFLISNLLKQYHYENPSSGIHYHVDCTDCYHLFNSANVAENANWILNELDNWKYGGTYNTRRINFSNGHNWVRFQSGFKTMEFRCGNMTFDYEVLIKRCIHASDIVDKFKKKLLEDIQITHPLIKYKEDNIQQILKTRTEKI